ETASSLVPIILKEKWCSDLMGLSLKNITLTVKKGDKPIFKDLGEMMFTHFGISGPLVLSASALIDGKISDFKLFVDLKPGLDEQKLDARILRDFADEKNKAFRNSLNRLLPRALCSIIVGLSGINAETPVNSITREERRNLVNLIKAMPLTPIGLRPVEEAVVTRGGVSTKEINPKTMESKKLKGLFFCGEVMDVDAVTGGFNLQIAFSTGFLAGTNSVL
ncbi:MAG: aminoacetone oxidase family FAD-binding enzyme, partial [Oscillospiraceae bacterium]